MEGILTCLVTDKKSHLLPFLPLSPSSTRFPSEFSHSLISFLLGSPHGKVKSKNCYVICNSRDIETRATWKVKHFLVFSELHLHNLNHLIIPD